MRDTSKKRFKAVVNMIDVGRMIYEEGIEKRKRDVNKTANKEILNSPRRIQKKIMALPQDVIEVIGTEIFEINSIEALKKYF